jgi:hypothetical protein
MSPKSFNRNWILLRIRLRVLAATYNLRQIMDTVQKQKEKLGVEN